MTQKPEKMMIMMMMTEQIPQLCHLLTQNQNTKINIQTQPREVGVVAIATGCKTSVATTHTNAKDDKDDNDYGTNRANPSSVNPKTRRNITTNIKHKRRR
jgi:hypothetical protein